METHILIFLAAPATCVEIPWPEIEPLPQQWQSWILNSLSHKGTAVNSSLKGRLMEPPLKSGEVGMIIMIVLLEIFLEKNEWCSHFADEETESQRGYVLCLTDESDCLLLHVMRLSRAPWGFWAQKTFSPTSGL